MPLELARNCCVNRARRQVRVPGREPAKRNDTRGEMWAASEKSHPKVPQSASPTTLYRTDWLTSNFLPHSPVNHRARDQKPKTKSCGLKGRLMTTANCAQCRINWGNERMNTFMNLHAKQKAKTMTEPQLLSHKNALRAKVACSSWGGWLRDKDFPAIEAEVEAMKIAKNYSSNSPVNCLNVLFIWKVIKIIKC